MWIKPYTTYLYPGAKKPDFKQRIRGRFFKPVTAYLVTLNDVSIIFNLYYKTSLEKFQAMDAKKRDEVLDFIPQIESNHTMQNIFYR